MQSSYQANHFGDLLYAIVRIYKPETCVELGCLEGYSSIHIARALQSNQKGSLTIIDLFEKYPFNSSSQTTLSENLSQYGLLDYCKIVQGSAFVQSDVFQNSSIDFLHIDISNDGEALGAIFDAWGSKLRNNSIIVFEGGSAERDDVNWMHDYKKQPIRDFLNSKAFKNEFEHFVFSPFPSLTICRKRG